MRNGSSRERGNAAIILLLAILVLATMFAATLSSGSAAAVATEADRCAREQAKANAKSALVDADPWLQSRVVPSLEAILKDMAKDKVSFTGPHLVTTKFPTYEHRFAMSGTGATADDYADVTATVSLAGEPVERSLAGVTGKGAPIRTQEYRFTVRMVSEGHAPGGAVVRYEHFATLYVEIEVGPAA